MQYLQLVDILFELYRGERTGDIEVSISAGKHILPYLAAGNRNLYTAALWLYLQTLEQLPTTHPDLQDILKSDGPHAIRSFRYWGAVSSDQVIEQVLMRSLKTTGGLTGPGKGLNDEASRNQWLYSRTICAATSDAIQEITHGVKYSTSDQHQEASSTHVLK